MASTRPFAAVSTRDAWLRAAHVDTFIDPEHGAVGLDWEPEAPPSPEVEVPPPPHGAGLAFDAECRLYHSLPDAGRVEVLLWAAPDGASRAPSPFLGGPPAPPAPRPAGGTFSPAPTSPLSISRPLGLAVDVDDRLFVAEAGRRRVLVVDLWGRRLLRSSPLAPAAGAPRPLDVAACGSMVHAVAEDPAGYFTLDARRGPHRQPLDPRIAAPSRVACSPGGEVVILDSAGTAAARVWPLTHLEDAFDAPWATDVEFEREGVLVVAGRPEAPFRRVLLELGRVSDLSPLAARGYDGLGITRTPEAKPRIAYWTAGGVRHAAPARLRYRPRGRVTTFRLDSGALQTRWGRLFLDACIPEGTQVRASCIALDELPEDEPPLPRTPPSQLIREVVPRPDLSPPMPPQSLWPAGPLPQHLHRRESGRELPWAPLPATDPFETYEAPVDAPPGRYLWVVLELEGTRHRTPRVRAIRAEHPGHDLLRRLPRAFSRDEAVADFLRRFLSMFDGFLGDLDARAADREAMVMPRAAPAELLPWLASFLGLVFDRRWPERARRAILDEASLLFRRRGTPWALERMISLALGVRPILLEHYRLRGIGAGVLGTGGGSELSSSVLGAGFRVGGQVGTETATPLEGSLEDAFQARAHRFSVIVPAALTQDEREMIDFILEAHRPAHTAYDVCTVDAGMRVGLGLHLELSSIVGRTGGFIPLQLGGVALGRGTTIGRPDPGAVLGQSRVGRDSRVG